MVSAPKLFLGILSSVCWMQMKRTLGTPHDKYKRAVLRLYIFGDRAGCGRCLLLLSAIVVASCCQARRRMFNAMLSGLLGIWSRCVRVFGYLYFITISARERRDRQYNLCGNALSCGFRLTEICFLYRQSPCQYEMYRSGICLCTIEPLNEGGTYNHHIWKYGLDFMYPLVHMNI